MNFSQDKLKVALIHDHLAQNGGAEKVLKAFTEMFPEAPIYTLLYDKENVAKNFQGKDIRSSIIQKMPGGIKHYKWYMPFMPMAVEFFDLSSYDLVLSDASAFAKGVITTTNTLHICYCHTPTRYVWSDTHSYINELKYNKYFKKVISLILNYIRIWDRMAADRVDVYIANTKFIAKRIAKYYRRESTVIYPPAEVEKFRVSAQIGDYYLIGGRLAPYKRNDIVIEAFKQLTIINYQLSINGVKTKPKLKIYGDGVDMGRLKEIAGGADNIEFLGRVTDEEKISLYSKCIAFINPQEEDFGITPVEAMASGRPVIAYGRGGALETVIDGVTGQFFYEQTADSLAEVILKFNPLKFNPEKIREYAQKFSTDRFKNEVTEFINNKWIEFNK